MITVRVSSKFGVPWHLVVGGAAALGVVALGWLELATAPSPDAADASIREFGTLLTVVSGSIAALWWNQSARLPDTKPDRKETGQGPEMDSSSLHAAAATFLSVFCSVFAGSPWRSTGSWLSAIAALVELACAGNDVLRAVPITLRQRPVFREMVVLVLIAVGAAALIGHFEFSIVR